MHGPDTILLSSHSHMITMTRVQYLSKRVYGFREKVVRTDGRTDRNWEILYRLAVQPVKNGQISMLNSKDTSNCIWYACILLRYHFRVHWLCHEPVEYAKPRLEYTFQHPNFWNEIQIMLLTVHDITISWNVHF